jgi:hypothetical protein
LSSEQGGFSVYIRELISAGKRFQTMAIGYREAMPNAGFQQADGGNFAINGIMDTTLRMVGELHLMIAQAMHIHGEKIVTVGQRYELADDYVSHNVNNVLQEIVNAEHHPASLPSSFPGTN